MGVIIDWLDGYAPVQAEGTIDGYYFYFKARGKRWFIEISFVRDEDGDPLVIGTEAMAAGLGFFYSEPYDQPGFGEFPASYMPHEVARQYIMATERRLHVFQAELHKGNTDVSGSA